MIFFVKITNFENNTIEKNLEEEILENENELINLVKIILLKNLIIKMIKMKIVYYI